MKPRPGADPLENFDAVYEAHYQDVYRAARAIVLDAELAEDLTQETFVKAYRKRKAYRPTGSVGAWLHRIAVNVALSHLRWSALQERMLRAVGTARQLEPEAGLRDEVTALLSALPPGTRAAIVLHHYHGYRYREIAHLLGIPEGTVATRISNGLRRMRLLLESSTEGIVGTKR